MGGNLGIHFPYYYSFFSPLLHLFTQQMGIRSSVLQQEQIAALRSISATQQEQSTALRSMQQDQSTALRLLGAMQQDQSTALREQSTVLRSIGAMQQEQTATLQAVVLTIGLMNSRLNEERIGAGPRALAAPPQFPPAGESLCCLFICAPVVQKFNHPHVLAIACCRCRCCWRDRTWRSSAAVTSCG